MSEEKRVLTLPSIFGDHMVLQQGRPIPVWGKANPGEPVAITLGDTTAQTVADADGNWRVKLPKRTPGNALHMAVQTAQEKLEYNDILVGEVWLASGQSNMEWSLKDTDHAEEDAAAATNSDIRLFHAQLKTADAPQDDLQGQWAVCTPETAADFSAVGYLFAQELHKSLKCPIAIIHSSWGGTPAEAWTGRATLEADPEFKKTIVEASDKVVANFPKARAVYEEALTQWQQAAEQAKANGQPEPPQPAYDHVTLADQWQAGRLYNAMIHPLIPYAIQGAIWYQGESNAWHAWQYRRLFPMMIQDWREAWGQGDFPFYFVQLANFDPRQTEPGPSLWAELREAQTLTLAVRDTGMAVAIDIGEATDIHPRNKRDVAKRLALNALANTYGHTVEYSGPMLRSVCIDGAEIHLSFSHADGLTSKDGPPSRFALAGADQKFVWADAVIKGEAIVVTSPAVPKPVAVRYGWADNPECNLYNRAGLPASPFRTDNWPLTTHTY